MCPEVGLLGHMATLLLHLWGISILIFILAALIYITSNSVGGFPFLHTPATVICRHFDDGHSDLCEVIPHCPTSPFWRRSTLGFLWKEWCYSWNSSTLATSCKELTHWKRLWCWEGLGAGGEGDDRGWDGWMASRTRWTWVWMNSGRWWWTGRPCVLQFMGLQRVGHD